jgi:hypothetical protein
MENLEMQEYHRQLRQRPHMISTCANNDSAKSSDKKKNPTSYQTRYSKFRTIKTVSHVLSAVTSICN